MYAEKYMNTPLLNGGNKIIVLIDGYFNEHFCNTQKKTFSGKK